MKTILLSIFFLSGTLFAADAEPPQVKRKPKKETKVVVRAERPSQTKGPIHEKWIEY